MAWDDKKAGHTTGPFTFPQTQQQIYKIIVKTDS